MKPFKIFGIVLLGLVVLVAISFGTGMLDVLYIKTVGKAKQDATRTVFEETNSFTKAKRQECIKYFKEYNECTTAEDRKAIETVVSMSLADFDEDKYITNAKLLAWVKRMKYGS